MAKATLPTNYKDDIMATQMGGLRRYRPIQNDDGTVSFEDVTNYTQVGNNFGAAQMNQTNTAVNNSADKSRIIDSLADVAANTQDGMMAGALAVRELNGKISEIVVAQGDIGQQNSMVTFSNIIMQKFTSNRCNIHIQFGVEILNTESENVVAFDMQKLKGFLGLSSLIFDPYSANIRLINKSFPKLETSVRTGYYIDNKGQILRFYKYGDSNTGFSTYSVKDLSTTQGFLAIDGLYEIDILGASYN